MLGLVYRYSEWDRRQKKFVAMEQLLLWQQMHTLDLPSVIVTQLQRKTRCHELKEKCHAI